MGATEGWRRPGRTALTGWSLVMLLSVVLGIGVFCVAVTSISLIIVWVGIPLTLAALPMLRGLANVRRWWVGWVLGEAVPQPYRRPTRPGMMGPLRTVLGDPATYRDLAWVLVDAVVGVAMYFVPLTFLLGTGWFLVLPLLIHLVPGVFDTNLGVARIITPLDAVGYGYPLAAASFALFFLLVRPFQVGYARLARSLLAPTKSALLAQRVAELAESRAETVDTQAAELRRIERDLHDGAQARLVSLGMSLGLAESLFAADPEAARELLVEARESTGLALSELRDLVRGIHPPVLADRGLDGAVRALALAGPLPVEVTADLPGRPPAPVESAMYFAVAEALANIAKHSGAGSAWIRLAYADGRLGAMVGDDGRGGAVASAGGGLSGVERRLAAFDGTMMVTSPVGGPTIVTMELPCELSSAKTSPSSGTA